MARIEPIVPYLRSFWKDLGALLRVAGQVAVRSRKQAKGHKRLHASSLAFKTILALIPALAILMAVLADDAFKEKREMILDQFVDAIYPVQTQTDNSFLDPDEPGNLRQLNEAGKQEIRHSIRKFARHARNVGVLGFVGFIVVVFFLMRDVERAFNLLWGVDKGRSLLKQLLRHSVFFVGLPALTVVLLTAKGWAGGLFLLGPLFQAKFFSSLLSFAVLWTACTWMYLWIPHAKVEKRPAVMTGLLAAALLGLARSGMNWYTVKVVHGSNLYGAIWMVPVILIWFYLCWTIILFCAEVTYTLQHPSSRA